MYNKSGVPITRVLPSDLFNPIYKSATLEKNFYTRRTFRYGLLKYSIFAFIAGGYLVTDSDYFKNEFMSRPDLNVSRKMTDLPDKEKKVFEMFGNNYQGKDFKNEPSSWAKRIKNKFYYSVHYDPNPSDYLPFYDYKNRPYHPDDISSYYSQ
jgi:hypothetical protein